MRQLLKVSQKPHPKGKIMNIATTKATAVIAVTIALTIAMNVSPAFAFPDPGEPGAPGPGYQTSDPHRVATTTGVRLLERIGTQFVRGDDLTGAGVSAPSWVPEAG